MFGTKVAPFSAETQRMLGLRSITPWQISAQIMSWMARLTPSMHSLQRIAAIESDLAASAAAPPFVDLVITRIRAMQDHEDVRFVDLGPEPVELAVTRRTRSEPARSRSGANQDVLDALREQIVDLRFSMFRAGERDIAAGEDAVLVVVGPLVGDPGVERVDAGGDQIDVVAHVAFDHRGERREDKLGMDLLLVEQLEARLQVPQIRAGSAADRRSSRGATGPPCCRRGTTFHGCRARRQLRKSGWESIRRYARSPPVWCGH